MTTPRLTIHEINAFDRDQFVAALGSLFEGPPWIAEAAWQMRPFSDRATLYDALCAAMYNAPPEQHAALIQAHPDLVGRAALAGTLAPASSQEQAAAGLDRLTLDEIAAFTRLNAAYHERFGFPFVVCARENKKESILAGFSARLDNTREQEIHTALREIAKIGQLRLFDIVPEDK